VIGTFVAGKIIAILCFVVAGILAASPSRLGGALPHGIAGVGGGIYLALFPLQGFEGVPVAAGETDQPERSIPRATIAALALSALLFVMVQAALVVSYPHLGVASDRPLVDAARWLDPRLGAVVLVGSIVSIGGFTAGSALSSPRYAHALAVHGMLPARLAAVHTRFGTPHVAIVVTAFFAATLGLLFDYRSLVGMSNVTVLFQYFATCIAVPVLRRRVPAATATWRIPGGIVVPVLGAASSLVLLYGATRSEVLVAAACLALGGLVVMVVRNTGTAPRS
jgi:amino acid transporter